MARNSELIRQWEILRAIDATRNGIPVPKLAAAQDVHQRTIRRDIEALSKAGVPFIFATGYDAHIIPETYAEVPRCEKPADAMQLARLLGQVMGR